MSPCCESRRAGDPEFVSSKESGSWDGRLQSRIFVDRVVDVCGQLAGAR